MKFVAIALAACTASLHAQITVTLNRPAAQPPEVEIRNDSTLALSAFAISMPARPEEAEGGPFVAFFDAAVDSAPMPLATGRKYSVPLPSRYRKGQAPQPFHTPPVTSAAIFADGTTTGDSTLLARLILRRCNMLQAVELALDTLSSAGRHNVPRAQLVGQFQQLADSLNHWYLPPEQQAGRSVYQSIVSHLMSLPDLPFGAAFPPTSFVEQEMAALNRRRTTLTESRPGLSVTAFAR
jgi:hypothetical protein